jgi:CHAD domain-containing protein
MSTSLTVGEYAYGILSKQYQHILKQELGVLAGLDPEYLHQMRVGSRRLRTALQVFGCVVKLPKAAREKQVQALAKVLGRLRDLDVQLADLQHEYFPRLRSRERKSLTKAIETLKKQRQDIFVEVTVALTQPAFHTLKAAYAEWFQQPQYTSLAPLPLFTLLPDLLNPLLSALLLHPGWLVSVQDLSDANATVLHDLRKTCKHVRYQAEFFSRFYDSEFQNWVGELKILQEGLGKVQDGQVLLKLLSDELCGEVLPGLQKAIQENQAGAMVDWERLRGQYLNPDFRYFLHQMILKPSMPAKVHNCHN